MNVELPPPKSISPLIRAGRWGFFLAGIFYGYTKLQRLRKYDEPLYNAEVERRTKQHIKDLKDKEIQDKENMAALAREAGITPKN